MAGDLNIFQPVFFAGDNNIGGNGIAGLQLVESRGWLEGIGHHHFVHESGYRFVVDVGGSGVLVDRNNRALESIAFDAGLRVRGAGLRLSPVAGGNESEQGAQAERRESGRKKPGMASHIKF